MTSRPMVSVVQSALVAALRPDSIGRCAKTGPRWSCEDSWECRVLAAHTCQQEQVVRFGVRSFQQDAATAADFDCAFAFPEAWSLNVCAWRISGLMVRASCFTRLGRIRAKIQRVREFCETCPIEGTVWRIRLGISVVCLLSLLTQYVLTDTALCWLVFCSFRSNQDVCLKWLESSCCFLEHSSSSLVERCWKNFMCRWETCNTVWQGHIHTALWL